MKLQADRATLMKALAHVQSVVERRNTIPILANVMIAVREGKLSLTATDMVPPMGRPQPTGRTRRAVTDARVVDEGRVVTAAGVTSALDLGLHLVGRFWGDEARSRIVAQMEYR